MPTIAIEISRYVDDEPQPGIVECTLIDAHGVSHTFVEKVPIVSEMNLRSDSQYPQPGGINCTLETRWEDSDGRMIVRVGTEHPWGVESTQGAKVFDVLSSQVS